MSTLDEIVIDTDSWRKDLNPTSIRQVQIPIFDFVDENHPILKQVIPPFVFSPDFDAAGFASSMVETCRKHGGLGLAANQCGKNVRMFVMGSKDSYVAHFNPAILESSDDEVVLDEGCLSFPNLFLKVKRPSYVRITYQDYNGHHHEREYSGITARVFQHELDHLNGVCYTGRVGQVSLHLARKKQTKLAKGMKK